MNKLLTKLRSVAKKAAQVEVETNDKVLGIGLCTSVARGDVWSASDIDFLVVSEDVENRKFRTESFEGVHVDWHFYGRKYVDRLIEGYPQSFGEKRLPNLLYECVTLYDPQSYLKKAHQFAEKHRFSLEVVSLRAQNAVARGRTELEKCQECLKEAEYVPAILCAREASFWAAAALIELDKKVIHQKEVHPTVKVRS